ncbi:MAG: CpaD family pilus assembly protein [Pseudomonadota bacterium]
MTNSVLDNGYRSRRTVRMLKLSAAALFIGFPLAACQHTIQGSVPTDGYRSVHPIVLKEVPETLDVPVGMKTTRLSKAQRHQIAGFARESAEQGNGSVEIMVPSGSANESTAHFMASKIRGIVNRAGIPSHSIGVQAYAVQDPQAVAPIRLSYAKIQASVGPCGIWPDNLAANIENADYYEYGCSTQSNLAAMIANPSDLLHPRASTPADATRRSTVVDKYQKGESTASAKEEGGSEISDVGG